jgi:hypothetical protein
MHICEEVHIKPPLELYAVLSDGTTSMITKPAVLKTRKASASSNGTDDVYAQGLPPRTRVRRKKAARNQFTRQPLLLQKHDIVKNRRKSSLPKTVIEESEKDDEEMDVKPSTSMCGVSI